MEIHYMQSMEEFIQTISKSRWHVYPVQNTIHLHSNRRTFNDLLKGSFLAKADKPTRPGFVFERFWKGNQRQHYYWQEHIVLRISDPFGLIQNKRDNAIIHYYSVIERKVVTWRSPHTYLVIVTRCTDRSIMSVLGVTQIRTDTFNS